jgi:hypothetical protein
MRVWRVAEVLAPLCARCKVPANGFSNRSPGLPVNSRQPRIATNDLRVRGRPILAAMAPADRASVPADQADSTSPIGQRTS